MAEPPRLLRAALSRPVARLAYHEPCLVQTAKAKCLLDLRSRRAVRARVCLAGQVKELPDCEPPPLDLCRRPVGSLLVAQLHVLAEEYSSGSRF